MEDQWSTSYQDSRSSNSAFHCDFACLGENRIRASGPKCKKHRGFWPAQKIRETLCESGRWIDALKKGGRVLKKRERVLKKRGRFLRSGV